MYKRIVSLAENCDGARLFEGDERGVEVFSDPRSGGRGALRSHSDPPSRDVVPSTRNQVGLSSISQFVLL